VLGSEKQELLETIIDRIPHSRKEPEEITGRKRSDLSRTLKTMFRYRIVALKNPRKSVIPMVKATNCRVEFNLEQLA
jgi:predicted transcriptional regulator